MKQQKMTMKKEKGFENWEPKDWDFDPDNWHLEPAGWENPGKKYRSGKKKNGYNKLKINN